MGETISQTTPVARKPHVLHVVATWVDGGDRYVMRSDGVVFRWDRGFDKWEVPHHEPFKPIPGLDEPCAPDATPA